MRFAGLPRTRHDGCGRSGIYGRVRVGFAGSARTGHDCCGRSARYKLDAAAFSWSAYGAVFSQVAVITVDPRQLAAVAPKSPLADALLSGGGEINLTEMTDDALLQLVRLDLHAALKE